MFAESDSSTLPLSSGHAQRWLFRLLNQVCDITSGLNLWQVHPYFKELPNSIQQYKFLWLDVPLWLRRELVMGSTLKSPRKYHFHLGIHSKTEVKLRNKNWTSVMSNAFCNLSLLIMELLYADYFLYQWLPLFVLLMNINLSQLCGSIPLRLTSQPMQSF